MNNRSNLSPAAKRLSRKDKASHKKVDRHRPSQDTRNGAEASTIAKPTESNAKADGAVKVRMPVTKKLGFSLIVLLGFYAFVEGMLYLTGIPPETRVERMAFTFPIDDYNKNAPQPFLRRDDELFWRPQANVVGHNTHGFYGPDFSLQKPEGVYRIVCLGDSCTHFGPVSYPDLLRARLEKFAPNQFEVINAGVIGYTSYQGKQLLLNEALAWEPDLITVYFGWNDHWLARGYEDKNQKPAQTNPLLGLAGNLRTFRLMRLLLNPQLQKQAVTNRVSLEDYEQNLVDMKDAARQHDCDVCFITAAHALDVGIPPYLLTSGEIASVATLIPMHAQYNNIVRRVAQDSSACLVDLDGEFESMDKSQLFIEDHIHLSPLGRDYLADRLVKELRDCVLKDRPEWQADLSTLNVNPGL